MPSINLKRSVYDALVKLGEDPIEVANREAARYLSEEHDVEVV